MLTTDAAADSGFMKTPAAPYWSSPPTFHPSVGLLTHRDMGQRALFRPGGSAEEDPAGFHPSVDHFD